jgi:lysophospholipase L1-like esterase
MSARRAAEALFLILVPLGAFLLLSELALRAYLARNIFYDVEMSRYALTLKVDSENPRIGHHHRPSSQATLMGVPVQTNADGFRDDEVPVARSGKRRLVFLGDSLTLGWGVAKEDTFEHLLEARLGELAPTEILNLGVGNYNTTQEVALFAEKGLKYGPDEVVLFYFINDAEPVPQRSRFPGLGHYRIVTFYWSRLKALKARLSPGAGFAEYYGALYRDGAEGWERSQAALLELRELSRAHGFGLKVVLLPELHRLDPYTFEREHALVAEFLRANGIPVLDLAPHFRGVPEPQALWVSRDDAHPNARAHRMIADYTLPLLGEASHTWSAN